MVAVTPHSLAWNVGMRLMDKLDAIDTVPIPRNADTDDVQRLLDKPKSFKLKVIDSSAIASTYLLQPVAKAMVGIVYMHGRYAEPVYIRWLFIRSIACISLLALQHRGGG